MLTDYISKTNDSKAHDVNNSEHKEWELAVENENIIHPKKLNSSHLSLTILSSNSAFFPIGMEINIQYFQIIWFS